VEREDLFEVVAGADDRAAQVEPSEDGLEDRDLQVSSGRSKLRTTAAFTRRPGFPPALSVRTTERPVAAGRLDIEWQRRKV
jgi:hypothetical protein